MTVNALDYIQQSFDECIAPNVTASDEMKKLIKTRVLRKIVIDIAQREIPLHSSFTPDELVELYLQCFTLANLI